MKRLIFFNIWQCKIPTLMLIKKKKKQNQIATVHTLKMWPIYLENMSINKYK